jgi:hypothetical protein
VIKAFFPVNSSGIESIVTACRFTGAQADCFQLRQY